MEHQGHEEYHDAAPSSLLQLASPVSSSTPIPTTKASTSLNDAPTRKKKIKKPSYAPPYLDAFTVQSHRLLSTTRQELARHRKHQTPSKEPIADLKDLVASARLLVEPIQIPDLKHTGVLPWSLSVPPRSPVSKQPNSVISMPPYAMQGEEVKLFYPTGAKNVNLRDYIQETLQKHMVVSSSSPSLPKPSPDKASSTKHKSNSSDMEPSASSPAIMTTSQTSPSKKYHAKSTKKHPAFAHVSSSMTPSPHKVQLLDRELDRQAREVVLAVRANSSKINDLIAQ